MQRKLRLASLCCSLAAALAPARAEPPDLPSLSCTVVLQEVSAAMRLQVRFENAASIPLELPPGPQLVLYSDSAATERLDAAARMDRVQRTPILVPPQGQAEVLFAIAPSELGQLQCAQAKPAVAAMYFYRFSQRPQSRCILQGFDLQAIACPSPPAPAPASSKPQ